jgi:hypothetical protein
MGAMQYGLRWASRLARGVRQLRVAAPRAVRRIAMPMLVLGTTACYGQISEPRLRGSWVYEVDAPAAGSRILTVDATFEDAHTERIGLPREMAPYIRDLKVRTGNGFRTVERRGDEWFERSCNWRCTVRYSVDLDALAAGCGDEVDCARRVGEATLSPSLAWLVHPIPRHDVPVTVYARSSSGTPFASGMSAIDDEGRTFAFRSFDLDEGSFTAFGPMRRFRLDVPGDRGSKARIDVAVLGTHTYAMSDAAIRVWIEDAAEVTASLFGRFPVPRATIFVVPAKGEDEVVFGKVLSLAGASVVLVLGDKMQASARHRDWVLVHELFHLGFPTFRGEGRWLGEGLATYYEPVLRARAGWTTPGEVFSQFARNMPRGQPAHGPFAGLAAREDLDTIYWGGALFALAADVRIREETRGKKSLDDALRALLDRGGDATRVWRVRDVVRVGDVATGTNVLSSMYDHYAARGERIDLQGLLASLGVSPNATPANAANIASSSSRSGGAVDGEPDESGPLAWIRRGIVEAPPNPVIAQTTRP